jgi:hypothetical protein
MVDSFESAIDKVFTHPVTKDEYGPIRLPPPQTYFLSADGSSFVAFAEDCCGNYFTTTEDGAVWFWDHESNEMAPLAHSMADFITLCSTPSAVELDRDKVKSLWIDPTFAKLSGIAAPKNGWLKKPRSTK